MSKKKWKIAFGISLLVFIVVSYFFLPVWWTLSNCAKGPLWAAYLHPFPLSLYISLMFWFSYQAFRSPNKIIHRKWLIAFWVNCAPGAIFYWWYITVANEILSKPPGYIRFTRPEAALDLFFLSIPALVLSSAQLMFAWLVFSVEKVDQGQKEPVKEEHVIEDISRDEAVARMKERYQQDKKQWSEE